MNIDVASLTPTAPATALALAVAPSLSAALLSGAQAAIAEVRAAVATAVSHMMAGVAVIVRLSHSAHRTPL